MPLASRELTLPRGGPSKTALMSHFQHPQLMTVPSHAQLTWDNGTLAQAVQKCWVKALSRVHAFLVRMHSSSSAAAAMLSKSMHLACMPLADVHSCLGPFETPFFCSSACRGVRLAGQRLYWMA